MTSSENDKMLDSTAAAAHGRVRVETWSAVYYPGTDSFNLHISWQGFGYGWCLPAAKGLVIIAMLEAASRARAAVYYDFDPNTLAWSTARIPV